MADVDVDVVIDTVHVVDLVVIDDVADVVGVVDGVDVAVVDSKPASCPLCSAQCRAYIVQLPPDISQSHLVAWQLLMSAVTCLWRLQALGSFYSSTPREGG